MTQYKARIDIRVENDTFNLSHVKADMTSPRFRVFKADWRLSRDQEKHWVILADLDNKWAELSIEFIAGGTGKVILEFRGGYFGDLNTNRHEVWLDDVKLEGGVIINGGFEELDKDNKIAGWEGIKAVNNGNIKARTGKRCVLVWHDEPAVQKVSVAAGKRYKASAWFRPNDI